MDSEKSAVVVGLGSIGRRHANILTRMGYSVSGVGTNAAADFGMRRYPSVVEAIAQSNPNYVIVANETSRHADALKLVRHAARYVGPALVEKPIFADLSESAGISPKNTYVGYQLRFHPVVSRIRRMVLSAGGALTASFYVGQDLETWRPDRPAHETYSAYSHRGGGVLRDLSHELDLALWMFGECRAITALGGKVADVTVDSDDAWGILGKFERCPVVGVHLNYLDRKRRRHLVVNTKQHTIAGDLAAGTISIDGQEEDVTVEADESMMNMHRSILTENGGDACDFRNGVEVVDLIRRIEDAARQKSWSVS